MQRLHGLGRKGLSGLQCGGHLLQEALIGFPEHLEEDCTGICGLLQLTVHSPNASLTIDALDPGAPDDLIIGVAEVPLFHGGVRQHRSDHQGLWIVADGEAEWNTRYFHKHHTFRLRRSHTHASHQLGKAAAQARHGPDGHLSQELESSNEGPGVEPNSCARSFSGLRFPGKDNIAANMMGMNAREVGMTTAG